MATITYNANGGYNAPAPQTFTSYTTITQSKPSRSGYEFLGWAKTSGASSAVYVPGSTYSGDSITLYAVWQAITYTITYYANGGTSAPAKQTKAYGVYDFYLSSVVPVRSGYNFLGWGLKASTTAVAYSPGDRYIGNADLTLYAVWEAESISLSLTVDVSRCNASGTLTENGTYAKVTGSYIAGNGFDSIKIRYRLSSSSVTYTARTITTGGTSGTINEIVGGSFGIEDTYVFSVQLTDDVGKTTSVTKNLETLNYVIDFYAGGSGLTIGSSATSSGFNVTWPSSFNNTVAINEDITVEAPSEFNDSVDMGYANRLDLPDNVYFGTQPFITNMYGSRESGAANPTPVISNNLKIGNGLYIQLGNTTNSYQNFMRMNSSNQFEMTWPSSYPMMGDMGRELWSGYWSPGSSVSRTVSGASKYRVFLITLSGSSTTDSNAENNTWIIASRGYATYSSYRIAGGQSLPDGNGNTSMYFVGVYFQATNNSWVLRSCGQLGVKTNNGDQWSSSPRTNFTSLGVTRIIGLI